MSKALQDWGAQLSLDSAEAPLKATALATTLLVLKHIATVAVQVFAWACVSGWRRFDRLTDLGANALLVVAWDRGSSIPRSTRAACRGMDVTPLNRSINQSIDQPKPRAARASRAGSARRRTPP